MKNEGRIYVVSNGDDKHMVDAKTAAQAIGHVVRDKFKCYVATPRDVAGLLAAGVKIEKAGGE